MSQQIWVGQNETYRTIEAAVAASVAGDTIYVRAGVYAVEDLAIQHALTIIGVGGEVVLTTSRTLDRGLLVASADLTVENITFRGAWSNAGTGAAIVMDAGDLVVRDAKFEQNEAGIVAGDSAVGSITIQDSRFAGNGWGDSTAAAVVAGRGTELLTISDSYFIENASGHHIASRAAATVIERSILDDGQAGSSAASIDLPDGGRVVIEDNVIRKGAGGADQVAVNFGENASLAHTDSSLIVKSNVISDASGFGKAVVNGLPAWAIVQDNMTYGVGTISEGAATVSGNTQEAAQTVSGGGSGADGGSAFLSATTTSTTSHGVGAFSSESGASVSSVSIGNSGSATAAGDLSLAHTFLRGEIPNGAGLQVLVNGKLINATLVAQSTYDDGSIREATVSFLAPAIAAGNALNAVFVRGSLTPTDSTVDSGASSGTDTSAGTGSGGSSGTDTGAGTGSGGSSGTDTGAGTGSGGSSGTDTSTGTSSGGSSGTDTSTGTGSGGSSGTDTSAGTGSGGSSGTDTSAGTGSGGSSGTDTSAGTSNGGTPELGDTHIVDVTMVNSGTAARPAGYWTFGQVFKQGDLAAGDELYATINGQKVALQVDVKNTWDDGSVKHAILTVKTPTLAAGASATVELMRDTTPDGHGAALTVNQMLAGDLDLKLELNNLNGGSIVVDAKTVLADAINAGTVKTWLAGENAIEVAVRAKVSSGLEVEFDIRYHVDGTYTTDVIVRNDWAFTAGVSTVTYDVAIKDHGVVAYAEAGISHTRQATWHETIASSKSLSTMYGKFDSEYLSATGAIPAYNFSIGTSSSSLNSAYTSYKAADSTIMGNAGVATYMPSTGGREDIGPLPEWAVRYLQSMDPKAAEIMFGKADAAGSIPWHYRDEKTGEAVSIEDYGNLWIDGRVVGKSYLTAPVNPNAAAAGWTPDIAHTPSLTYLPYILTGNQYYLDETIAKVAWGIASLNPDYRGKADGLFHGYEQTREQAWSFRDLANLRFAIPENDPSFEYIDNLLNNNLDSYVRKYITNGIGDKYGDLEGFIDINTMNNRDKGAIAPWEEDYFTLALGMLADQGYSQAVDLLNWSSNFTAGRFLSAEEGFNPIAGIGYRLYVADPVTGSVVTTWAEAYSLTRKYAFGNTDPGTAYISSENYGFGYVASSLASMSVLAKIGNLDGMEAYGVIAEHAANTLNSMVNNGRFAYSFQAGPGGDSVNLADYRFGSSTAEALTGSDRADILLGGGGNDTLSGGAGTDALYGGAGDDSLFGGTGDDVLFGGAGSDTLIGGAGNDTMRGGSGADTFVFDARNFGRDVIDDFEIGVDRIVIASSALPNGVTTAEGVLALAYPGVDGGTVIEFGDGNTIVLNGIMPSALTGEAFLIQ